MKSVSMDERFKTYIRSRGFNSVADFARKCGVYPQAVFKHIRGENMPNIDRLFLYANTLGVGIEDLLMILYPSLVKQNRQHIINL